MNTKHTPGPWTATSRRVTAPETEDRLGLNVHIYGGNGQDNAANARLIAAAPELLEAVQSFAIWAEDQADGQSKGGHATFDLMLLREQRDIARAAIAKATGEQK